MPVCKCIVTVVLKHEKWVRIKKRSKKVKGIIQVFKQNFPELQFARI